MIFSSKKIGLPLFIFIAIAFAWVSLGGKVAIPDASSFKDYMPDASYLMTSPVAQETVTKPIKKKDNTATVMAVPKVGDIISIQHDGKTYRYTVSRTQMLPTEANAGITPQNNGSIIMIQQLTTAGESNPVLIEALPVGK